MTASLARAPDRRSARRSIRRLWRHVRRRLYGATHPLRQRGAQWLRRHITPYLPDVAAFFGALLCAGLAALLTGALAGCGGGVGSEGTGSVASGSFASGTISGYGSVIVNGVHFDESQAQVQGDDGQALAASSLALGMVVQVTGGPISQAADGSSRAVASTVRTQRALVGPVSARTVTPTPGTAQLTVLGQTVQVSTDTVFDERFAGGLAAVAVGQWLEVYGFYDSTSARFAATRIAPSGPSAGYRVSGPVMALDALAKTFTLGAQTYSFASLGQAPVADALVTLKLQSATDGGGRWVVSGQRAADAPPQEREGAELDGLVSAVLSASRFVVDGVTVDAGAARVSGTVRVGAPVEVSGTLRGGVLVATQVEATAGKVKTFEINGSLSSLDAANRRFVLRGTTVSYASGVVAYANGSAARLVGYVGKLKVQGVLSADRTLLEATRIKFED